MSSTLFRRTVFEVNKQTELLCCVVSLYQNRWADFDENV
jgi:hypothetical protein